MYNTDGSITLHQEKYISKLVERFLPDGVPQRVERNTLPYSRRFLEHIANALAQASVRRICGGAKVGTAVAAEAARL